MYSSQKRLRGQTSLEMLLIVSLIFVAVMLIISGYSQSSSSAVILLPIRSAASDAATYLNLGVMENTPVYEPLNNILSAHYNDGPLKFKFEGAMIQRENSTSILVALKFEHDLRLTDAQNATIARSIGQFVLNRLNQTDGFSMVDGNIYYGNRKITLNVTVGESQVVIP